MLNHLEVPEKFNRNARNVAALGAEETGAQLIELAIQHSGLTTLADADIIDIGCGVRFTQTLINRAIPLGSYTGIEVNRPIVDFLKNAVETEDPRFRFAHWDIHNAKYNAGGRLSLSQMDRLPVAGSFDLIWLFSVFTHMNADDAEAMLRILRHYARPSATLFFSAFIDEKISGFEDRIPEEPMLNVFFGLDTMNKMLERTGWVVKSFHKQEYHLPLDERANQLPIVDYFVCCPGGLVASVEEHEVPRQSDSGE